MIWMKWVKASWAYSIYSDFGQLILLLPYTGILDSFPESGVRIKAGSGSESLENPYHTKKPASDTLVAEAKEGGGGEHVGGLRERQLLRHLPDAELLQLHAVGNITYNGSGSLSRFEPGSGTLT